MSKAFTKDDDSGIEEELEDAPLLLPEGAKNYMTAEGADLFLQEFTALNNERHQVAGLATDTGKKRLREIDRRLRFLRPRLERLEVIGSAVQETARVLFGATVVLRADQAPDRTFRIVGIDEADPARGLISWISPLAKLLLGKKVGDDLVWKTPKGEEDVEIVTIRYESRPPARER